MKLTEKEYYDHEKQVEEFSKKTSREVLALKKKQCAKCYYFSRNQFTNAGETQGCCDYLEFENHIRPCNPFDCIEKGVFLPRANKKRQRRIRPLSLKG